MAAIPLIYGGASISPQSKFNSGPSLTPALNLLTSLGVTKIDTARLYEESERIIGDANGASNFTIDTKVLGGWKPGTATKQGVIDDVKDSLAKTKAGQFDVLFIHGPDKTIPIEETLAGINESYKSGAFKRFGLSNFSPQQVQEVYDISKAKNWILPTVYQGNFSAVARFAEAELIPLLRKLGIAFFVYSPIAGGFLTKTPQQIQEGAGRWVSGGMYAKLYNKPSYLEALQRWNEIAEKEGVSKVELAYRWVAWNSVIDPKLGDEVIFGASSLEQIEQTVNGIKKGPLSKEAADAIAALWKTVEKDAPVDNFVNTYGSS